MSLYNRKKTKKMFKSTKCKSSDGAAERPTVLLLRTLTGPAAPSDDITAALLLLFLFPASLEVTHDRLV